MMEIITMFFILIALLFASLFFPFSSNPSSYFVDFAVYISAYVQAVLFLCFFFWTLAETLVFNIRTKKLTSLIWYIGILLFLLGMLIAVVPSYGQTPFKIWAVIAVPLLLQGVRYAFDRKRFLRNLPFLIIGLVDLAWMGSHILINITVYGYRYERYIEGNVLPFISNLALQWGLLFVNIVCILIFSVINIVRFVDAKKLKNQKEVPAAEFEQP